MSKWARPRTASYRGCIASCSSGTFYRSLLFLFAIRVCHGVLVNRTIDNKFGDLATGFIPIYQPQTSWSYPGRSCSGVCITVQPDIAKAFDGTWNWTVYYPGQNFYPSRTITLQFTGVAIWVFFILFNFNSDSFFTANTHVNITLDGQYAGSYSYDAPNTDTAEDPIYIYNVTVFSTSGLTNVSHELIIGTTNDYPNTSYINFDWAIYSVDLGTPAPQNVSASQNAPSSTNVTFPSYTSSSYTATSATPTAQSSSSKIGIIVGWTLGGLAAITLVLVCLVLRLRRAPQVRNGAEVVLDIDVSPHHQPYFKREISVSEHGPTQSKAARLREMRQRELDERILSTQHELDSIRLDRNAGFSGEIGNPSAAGPSQASPELALLRNEVQQLRDRMDYLQAQRESDWGLGLSNEPPAYTQLSNNVQ